MALVIEMALRRRRPSVSLRYAVGRQRQRHAMAHARGRRLICVRGTYTPRVALSASLASRSRRLRVGCELATQQLSKARAGVLLSGVRAWQGTVGELLADKPELAKEGLRGHGNSDEMKLDNTRRSV